MFRRRALLAWTTNLITLPNLAPLLLPCRETEAYHPDAAAVLGDRIGGERRNRRRRRKRKRGPKRRPDQDGSEFIPNQGGEQADESGGFTSGGGDNNWNSGWWLSPEGIGGESSSSADGGFSSLGVGEEVEASSFNGQNTLGGKKGKKGKKGRKPKFVNRDKFFHKLGCDAKDAFGNTQDGDEELWDTYNSNAWEEVFTAGNETVRPVFCCINQQQMAGVDRVAEMRRLLMEDEDDSGNADNRASATMPVVTISNTGDETCAYLLTEPATAEIASEEDQENLSLLSLSSVLKLREGILHAALEERAMRFQIEMYPQDLEARSSHDCTILGEHWERMKINIAEYMARNKGRRRSLRRTANEEGHHPLSLWLGDSFRGPSSPEDRKRGLLWDPLEDVPFGGSTLHDRDKRRGICPRDIVSALNATFHESCEALTLQIGHEDPLEHRDRRRGWITPECVVEILYVISLHDRVLSVEAASDVTLLNDEAGWIVQSGQRGYKPLTDSGLTGRGQVVALSDSGLDTNNCYFQDTRGGFEKNGGVFAEQRKLVQYYPYKDDKEGIGSNAEGGHGTHVAGTIAGRNGFQPGIADGIARDAKLAFFDLADDEDETESKCCFLPGDFRLFLLVGGRAGAKIHNVSWGSSVNKYLKYDAMFDSFLAEHWDNVIVIAAGNEGPDPRTVGSPGSSKNAITVGASHSDGRDIYSGMLGKDYLAHFSSRGPTNDGRIKPDLIAPGFEILSARSSQIAGGCDPDEPPQLGEALDGVSYRRGSSMAAPVVSGAAALVRQYFQEGWYPTGSQVDGNGRDPSGALVKAILLNGAQSLHGAQMGDGTVKPISEYDSNQGFGRVSLLHSISLPGKNDISLLALDRVTIEMGKVDTTLVRIGTCFSATKNILSVTLVWYDPPSVSGCGECLLNDLDLSILNAGTNELHYPNGRSNRDDTNTAERIRMETRPGETYVVSVRAYDLVTDSQTYALVVTGCLDHGTSRDDILTGPRTGHMRSRRDFNL